MAKKKVVKRYTVVDAKFGKLIGIKKMKGLAKKLNKGNIGVSKAKVVGYKMTAIVSPETIDKICNLV